MWKSLGQRKVAEILACGLSGLLFVSHTAANGNEQSREYTLQQALSQQQELRHADQGVSLDRAIEQAVQFSKQTLVEQSNQLAESELGQAELVLPDPVLTLQLNNLPVTGPTGFDASAEPITRKTIGISQRWARQDRREKSSEVAMARSEQAKYRELDVISKLKQETAKAWLDAYYGQQMVDLLQERVDELAIRADAALALYNAGTGSQVNVFSAKTEKGLAALQLSRAKTQQANYLAQLQRWVGMAIHPGKEEFEPWASLDLPLERLLDATLYPSVQVIEQQAEQAKASLGLQQESLSPDWTLSLQYSQRDNNFSDTLSLAASRPLLLNSDEKQAREIAAAQARYEAVVAQKQEIERSMLTQVQQLHDNWQDGLSRVQELERDLLPLATQRTQAAMDEYRGNTGNLEQVLMARRMEIDLNIELLKIKMETARWWAQLQYLLPEQEAL